jgi:hypothetical protein
MYVAVAAAATAQRAKRVLQGEPASAYVVPFLRSSRQSHYMPHVSLTKQQQQQQQQQLHQGR